MKNKKNTSLILLLFLLGIFMGAIDSGIVTPAREIIQNSFKVARNAGVWMITLYTLSYSISMPIVSKMADRFGRKKIYTIGITLFGLGSALCGLSNFYGNFTFMLFARFIQAIGAGGIIPIATTVIGQSFPEEKRGTALGFVGAIYGVATIIGPTLGSSILKVSGNEHWGWIFFINIPISIIIIMLSFAMENTKSEVNKPMDYAGAVLLAGVVGSLMYALTNMDFFHFTAGIAQVNVYPYLILFVVLVPILIFVENMAQDPVLNLKYFKSKEMLTVFLLAFVVGIGMMGMVFVPQFAENVLKIKAGTGGYLVTLLAVFSGIAAPLSGKLIDKKGAAFVMLFGFVFNIIGTLFLGYVATVYLNFITILIGLAFMGFGVGFTMGAPLNYLVLQSVPKEEGTTAMAAMSLIRSVGVAISPSIMIGFIVDAAKNLQPELTAALQKQFSGIMPSGMTMNFGGNGTAKLFLPLQNSDVTTIVEMLKNILKQVIPGPGQAAVVAGIEKSRPVIEGTFQQVMDKGYTHMFTSAAIIAAIGAVTAVYLSKQKSFNHNHESLVEEKLNVDSEC